MRKEGWLPVLTALVVACCGGVALGQITDEELAALQEEGRREGWTFEMGRSEATERPLSELCGLVVPPDWTKNARFDTSTPDRDLPSAFDWRAVGGCTPIRNQGGCGSCWAFGTVAPLECEILIAEDGAPDLSEQWLVSCNREGWGCGGGWWAHDYHLWKTDPCGGTGAVLESDFRYTGTDAPCRCPYPHPYRSLSWTYIGGEFPTVEQMKQAIFEHGPISVALAVDNRFQAYRGGVFNGCTATQINHAVALVGWNDADGGYWILRNSWGNWGEGGYMRIRYGCDLVGYSACYVDYKPFTIRGTIRDTNGAPVPNVRIGGYPHAGTNVTGPTWIARVGQGWSGTLRPTRNGWSFQPETLEVTSISGNVTGLDFTGTQYFYSLAGRVVDPNGAPIRGVTLNGLPGNPTTDENGAYTTTIGGGWSGVVTPTKDYYTFVPATKTYTEIGTDLLTEDYVGIVFMFRVTGHVRDTNGQGLEAVWLRGFPQNTRTWADGGYYTDVPAGWNGTVTPEGLCYNFDPASRTYADGIYANTTDQDYTGSWATLTLSGTVRDGLGQPLEGVAMDGLAGVSTDPNGFYSSPVECGFYGTVTPRKQYYLFTPAAREYAQLAGSLAGEDYAAGPQHDCNHNNVPDELDILNGTSQDENGNGVPDECELLAGDLNCDGLVDFADISPFVVALSGHTEYHAAYPTCLWLNADCNHDGLVDFVDINPFVDLLAR